MRLFTSSSSAAAAATTTTETNNERFLKTYKLQGETMRGGNKSGVTVTTNTGHTLQTDLPRKMGGQDTAPQPVETLLAAWMGCTQATALFVGRHMTTTTNTKSSKQQRLLLDRLVFRDIQGFRDERGALTLPIEENPPVPSRLVRIQGTIVVYRAGGGSGGGEPITDDEMNLLQTQTELRCPIANMLIASGCQMDVTWIDGASLSEK